MIKIYLSYYLCPNSNSASKQNPEAGFSMVNTNLMMQESDISSICGQTDLFTLIIMVGGLSSCCRVISESAL